MLSNNSKKETQGEPIYSQHVEHANPPWQCKNWQTREKNSTSGQRACLLQSWYSCTEWNMPSGWRTAHRMWLWLHFLLEWMQWWRTERVVGFAIKLQIMWKHANLPKGISDQLMTLQLPLGHNKCAAVISAYTPSMTNLEEVKNRFYDELDTVIKAVSKSDKLLLLSNFNAREGSDHHPWNRVIGLQGTGKCNSNGLLLLQLCSTYNLVITNTLFHLPTCNKTSWMHLKSKHWHLIYYIITRKKDAKDIRVIKVMCGADCWTDHRLTLSKVDLKIAPKRHPQGKKVFKKLDMSRLKHKPTAEVLHGDLDKKLGNLNLGDVLVEDNWTACKDMVYSTAFEHLGPLKWNNQGWFDEKWCWNYILNCRRKSPPEATPKWFPLSLKESSFCQYLQGSAKHTA